MIAFCSLGYFPASGWRTRQAGRLLSVGAEGRSWGTSLLGIGSIYGSNLYFTSDSLLPLSTHGRCNGEPVRCVQAFI